MASLNKVILIGNVGNIDVKDLKSGNKLVQLSLATSSGYKDSNGDWKNKTEWHRCILSIPALAERGASISKGDVIHLEGSITTNAWETKEGEKKEIKEISVTNFSTFAKAKAKDEYNQPPTPTSQSAKATQSNTDDDDMPF